MIILNPNSKNTKLLNITDLLPDIELKPQNLPEKFSELSKPLNTT